MAAAEVNAGYDLLPKLLRDVAETCGLGAASALVEQYGGTSVYVSKTPEHGLTVGVVNYLRHKVGEETAISFQRFYGGEILVIPKAAAALRVIRDRQIRSDRLAGKLQANIAREHGLTERHVQRICAGIEVDSGQSDLFDFFAI